jgi:hypothetical protein
MAETLASRNSTQETGAKGHNRVVFPFIFICLVAQEAKFQVPEPNENHGTDIEGALLFRTQVSHPKIPIHFIGIRLQAFSCLLGCET